MVNTKGEVLTDIWKSAQELQQDIELVKISFEQWPSKSETGRSSEDAAFESLSEHYGSALASKKLALILENCFEKATDEDCGWVRN
ncbi:hypothetical protein [Vibrio lentus]|uniref:hypothetical protein n=1 Tax=Vibrio lentus TaxID=136468 RepID=UPI000C839A4B|nr:hypothetical protein [Vibrio lentus]PMM40587.1 hypothetical protein BCT58_00005 [Vibrio lentus]